MRAKFHKILRQYRPIAYLLISGCMFTLLMRHSRGRTDVRHRGTARVQLVREDSPSSCILFVFFITSTGLPHSPVAAAALFSEASIASCLTKHSRHTYRTYLLTLMLQWCFLNVHCNWEGYMTPQGYLGFCAIYS